jgi:hypothetical protein
MDNFSVNNPKNDVNVDPSEHIPSIELPMQKTMYNAVYSIELCWRILMNLKEGGIRNIYCN